METHKIIGIILCGIAGGIAGYFGGPMGIVAVLIAQLGIVTCFIY